LRGVNGRRDEWQPALQLCDAWRDTFTPNCSFDVFVEYGKANSEDILCRITAVNRGPEAEPIHILPHLWYRNTWSWQTAVERPVIRALGPGAAYTSQATLGERWWYVRATNNQPVELLFTENDTNLERLYHAPNAMP